MRAAQRVVMGKRPGNFTQSVFSRIICLGIEDNWEGAVLKQKRGFCSIFQQRSSGNLEVI